MNMSVDNSSIYFKQGDFSIFRDWLPLNYAGLTWQGRYQKEFDDFWNTFFVDGLSLGQITERFKILFTEVSVGPLQSWLNWLEERFLAYVFIYKNLDLIELADKTNIPIGTLAVVLRDFFLEHYPHLEEKISESFLVSSLIDENANLTYASLVKKLQVDKSIDGGHDEEIMPSMEVTLYEEWSYLLRRLKRLSGKPDELKRLAWKKILYRQMIILRDVVLLVLICLGVVFLIKRGNIYYEKYLAEKIKIYEPQFKWLNKNLVFQDPSELVTQEQMTLKNIQDIENVDDAASSFIDNEEASRFDVESDVILTSWDSLPRDFEQANLEQSKYEELRQRGYRDTRYGHTKVYRVMMKSVDPKITKEKLNQLLDLYKVTQVDNVRPGMPVPGGVYYNLYVPREHLKEFMAQVSEVEEAIIYESHTRTQRNPIGKNKVFIWVKSI